MAETQATRSHDVQISTRYGETTRECFCRVTNGMFHHEDDFPWRAQGEAEEPLAIPIRFGESVEEYKDRCIRAEAWAEGYLYRLKMATAPEAVDTEVALAAAAGVSNPYLDDPATPSP